MTHNLKRVVIVSELFFPDETSTAFIMTAIAKYLAENFEVIVFTGSKRSKKIKIDKSTLNEDLKNIKINRVSVPNLNKNILILRTIHFLTFSFCITLLVFFKIRKGDIILTVTNPAPLIVLLSFVRKIKNIRLILLVHDVFPENAVAAGVLRKKTISYRMINQVFLWAFDTVDTIISIGRDMSEIISNKIKKNVNKIFIVENWAELSTIKPLQRELSGIHSLGVINKVVVQYSGNLGRAQGILEFIEIIKLVQNKTVHFSFVGSGAFSDFVTKMTASLSNITIGGAYFRKDQAQILGSCDIALIILKEGMYGLGVPSKTYNILASGRPILFIGPKNSEVYRLVQENNIGWAFDWSEVSNIVAFLNCIVLEDLKYFHEIGVRSRKLAEANYSEAIQVKKIVNIVYNHFKIE